jgi:hypothetical protein
MTDKIVRQREKEIECMNRILLDVRTQREPSLLVRMRAHLVRDSRYHS